MRRNLSIPSAFSGAVGSGGVDVERDRGPAGFCGRPELPGDVNVLGGIGGDVPTFTITIATVSKQIFDNIH